VTQPGYSATTVYCPQPNYVGSLVCSSKSTSPHFFIIQSNGDYLEAFLFASSTVKFLDFFILCDFIGYYTLIFWSLMFLRAVKFPYFEIPHLALVFLIFWCCPARLFLDSFLDP
jgi:hypothetical protein